ncbi:MAG: hypothetical protein JKY30_11555, partial [Flavobacteriales bacterium]|nr:hypothetical protein [Flavobacteriales bacterium]
FHFALAKRENKTIELLNTYNQHKVITEFYKTLTETKSSILTKLNNLQAKGDASELEVGNLGQEINNMYTSLNISLKKIREISFIQIPNIDNTEELLEAIVEGGKFKVVAGPIFENEGFDKIMNYIENSIHSCQRVEQKNIGVILFLHKKLQN